MRKQFFVIVLFVINFIFPTSISSAQTKISSLVFGDYYFVTSNHKVDLENLNGFQIRRVYLTFDHQFEEKSLLARVRFEANSPGDFKSATKIEPYIKHLYLQWKANNNHTLYFGLSGPPTFGVVEEIWGYRHLEKTPLDLYGFGPSSDFGVALKGNLSSHFKYHGMVSNGAGTNSETNSGKKASFSLGYYPNSTFLVEGYVDTETRPGNNSWQTYQVFGAVKSNDGRAGFLLTRQNRDELGSDGKLDLASLFVVSEVSDKINLVGRYDWMFDPNPTGEKIAYLPFSSKAKSNLLIMGVDYKASKNLSLIPNIEYTVYDTDNATPTPKSDFISRFTVYFTF